MVVDGDVKNACNVLNGLFATPKPLATVAVRDEVSVTVGFVVIYVESKKYVLTPADI